MLIWRRMIYTAGPNVKVKTKVLNNLLLMDLLEDITLSLAQRFRNFHNCILLTQWRPIVFFCQGATGPNGPGPSRFEASLSYYNTSHSVGLLWTNDQPEAEIYTWQYTTLTGDRCQYPRWYSNLHSQDASDRSPTPDTVRPLKLPGLSYYVFEYAKSH